MKIRILFLSMFLWPSIAFATHLDYSLYRNLLDTGRIDQAKALREMYSTDRNLKEFFLVQEAFYAHAFEEAVNLYKASSPQTTKTMEKLAGDIAEILVPTATISQEFQRKRFEKFVMYFQGRDEILTLYAEEPLNRAFEFLNATFKHPQLPPIRIDIVPSWAEFEQMTPLSEKEIRTSGTIALCKYNRLIVTTPRSLLRGFDWIDTIVHEYLHYLVSLVSEGHAPVWLHEGIAKYFEKRWRMENPTLDLGSRTILSRYLKQDKLLDFETFHPSIAKLPSQELAQLAFAQAYMFIDYLVQEKGGETAVLKLLKGLAGGDSVSASFKKVYGKSWEELEAAWKTWLKTRDLNPSPRFEYEGRELVDTSKKREEEERLKTRELENQELHRALRLGDLLVRQNRHKAALYEYRKVGDREKRSQYPLLARKVTRVLMALGRSEAAASEMRSALEVYPGHPTLNKELGLILTEEKEWEGAEDYLQRSNAVNPYDPELHHALIRVYRALNREEDAEREEKALRILGEV